MRLPQRGARCRLTDSIASSASHSSLLPASTGHVPPPVDLCCALSWQHARCLVACRLRPVAAISILSLVRIVFSFAGMGEGV